MIRLPDLAPAAWCLGSLVLAQPAPPTPRPVASSDLVVRVDPAGRMPTHVNPTSPVAAGAALLLVDQAGHVFAWDGTASRELLGPSTRPHGMQWIGAEPLLGVAANPEGTTVYVMFIAADPPKGIPKRMSPRPGADAWQVLYRYDWSRTALSNPRAIAALQVRSEGHTGGGLAVLDDGAILFATGDSGDAFEDGRDYADDAANHLSKILRIDPAGGSVRVVARGVRNPQRLAVYRDARGARLDFVDMGGNVAEELNSIPLARLLGEGAMAHFGWGRSALDHNAREGTFHIDPRGRALRNHPDTEPGFESPVAQFGREGASLVGGTGPVSSTTSFTRIVSLFGDLVSGSVYAVTRPLSVVGQDVLRVALVDGQSRPVTLKDLTGGQKPSPRFFNFPDGVAGVLLEPTGDFYRLTEVTSGATAPRAAPADARQADGPRTATARFTDSAIAVDGRLDEPAWATAGVLDAFRFPWGDAARGEASLVRLLWGPDALYLGLRMTDAHIASAGTTVATMYDDDMFEVHIAPDAARPQLFFVLESNLRQIVTAQMRLANPDGTNNWYAAWDTAGMRQATTMSPAPGATGGAWTVELAIPFATLNPGRVRGTVPVPAKWTPAVPPVDGASWKLNVMRANRDAPGSTGSDFSVWSFNGSYAYGPGKDNMHFHDHNNFGLVRFAGRTASPNRLDRGRIARGDAHESRAGASPRAR